MSKPEANLSSLRQKTGLSQEDVAYLLGGTTAGMVCRYEKGSRSPTLEVAFAYAFLLGVPIQEIFENLERIARSQVKERAQTLLCSRGQQRSLNSKEHPGVATLERLIN